MDINLIENYEFEYQLFLAEQELSESLMCINNDIINESAGLIALNESFKETLLEYIKKISNAVTGIWEKFQKIILDKDKEFLDSIVDDISKLEDPKFTIENYPRYDFTKLNNIKIESFDYERMKEYLNSQDRFIEQFYPEIVKLEKGNIKARIEATVITSRQDTKCSVEMLKDMHHFCTEFPNTINNIKKDIDAVKNSNSKIETLVNSISVSQSANEAVCLFEELSIIKEEGEDNNKVSFKDDPDREKSNKTNDISKHVTNYIKINTSILSGKMKVYRDIYRLYMRTLKHCFK